MSLNTANCDGGVVIHQGEVILLHAPNAVLSFSGNEQLKIGEKGGNAYLTTHRLIFLAGKGHNSGSFQSFSFPFCVLSEVDVEQPMFGANYLKGKVRAQPDGNWRGEAKFKLLFKSGGAIDFAQGMVRAMQLAKQMTSQNTFWNTPPPSYSAATAPNSPYQQAPPSYYAAPNSYYGWAPPAYNFPPPEAGTVFVSEAPPPYPGIGGQGQMPQQQPYYQQQPAANPYGAAGYAPPQSPQNAGYPYPPQQTGAYPPQQTGAYPPQQNGVYPPQQNGGFAPYPQQQFGAAPGAGFYTAPPNGFAYANGNQAFVPPPSSAPPPYDFDAGSKKNN
ncbi:Postacrosomal sheath WW domain-binding protein [Orchesella cincta]|uniref:Postacrosomal sheath WW domain-binding protein n=1 Tax=Orchesella cincta TaxID=48709 RepID=A0A1D2MH49_ORCCI|nr:Postacrosomal sheath WW domain-binding protein [Orchesella cincta]